MKSVTLKFAPKIRSKVVSTVEMVFHRFLEKGNDLWCPIEQGEIIHTDSSIRGGIVTRYEYKLGSVHGFVNRIAMLVTPDDHTMAVSLVGIGRENGIDYLILRGV